MRPQAGLPPISDPYVANTALNQPAALLDELLYEKRYSLWGEFGTVWLDMRHYGKILQVPRYDATFKLFDVKFAQGAPGAMIDPQEYARFLQAAVELRR